MYASTHCILEVIISISYVIEKSDMHDDETITFYYPKMELLSNKVKPQEVTALHLYNNSSARKVCGLYEETKKIQKCNYFLIKMWVLYSK